MHIIFQIVKEVAITSILLVRNKSKNLVYVAYGRIKEKHKETKKNVINNITEVNPNIRYDNQISH